MSEAVDAGHEWESPLHRMALAQVARALPHTSVTQDVAACIAMPESSVIVSVPVRMDDGQTTVFPGYRV